MLDRMNVAAKNERQIKRKQARSSPMCNFSFLCGELPWLELLFVLLLPFYPPIPSPPAASVSAPHRCSARRQSVYMDVVHACKPLVPHWHHPPPSPSTTCIGTHVAYPSNRSNRSTHQHGTHAPAHPPRRNRRSSPSAAFPSSTVPTRTCRSQRSCALRPCPMCILPQRCVDVCVGVLIGIRAETKRHPQSKHRNQSTTICLSIRTYLPKGSTPPAVLSIRMRLLLPPAVFSM